MIRRCSKTAQIRSRVVFVLVILASLLSNSSLSQATSSPPVPAIWLDASNVNSYSGTGTQWNDLSGNGNHGTIMVDASRTPLPSVTFNPTTKAFEFSGGSNGGAYVDLAGNMRDFSAGITVEFEGEFGATRSIWERIFDFSESLDNASPGIRNAMWVGQFADRNELAIEVFDPAVVEGDAKRGYCYTATNGTALGSPTDRSFNKWLITVEPSGSAPNGACRIFKNGVEIRTRYIQRYPVNPPDLTPPNNTVPIPSTAFFLPATVDRTSNFLGRSNFLGDNDFEGSIRYIRIYNQSLSPQEAINNTSVVVTFNENGGSGSMAPQYSLTSTTLNTNTFTRNGFRFTGWNTDQNGTGTPYADQAIFPFTANTTLFAQWVEIPATNQSDSTPTTTTTLTPQVSTKTSRKQSLPQAGLGDALALGAFALVVFGLSITMISRRRASN
jgi:uncharacterized repeat protein (TIGR02543 family)